MRFDICGRLPVGTTVLEASAGTGKTYTIGALVTRYVAEGVATLDQILVTTFSRAASQELRERVRRHLVNAEAALRQGTSEDEVHRLLLDGDDDIVESRHQRVRDALADFDAATIATTHQFCELVRRSLGVAGDSDTTARFVDSLDDLVLDVVDDLYLQAFASSGTKPPFDLTIARRIAREATSDVHARLADADPASPSGAARVAFASRVREELSIRKRKGGLLSYNDMLSEVADALRPDGSLAAQRMRERWRIVLVDEFQDTDPVQWEVLERGFHGHSTMVLIGDPKQAIYGFRGGDVVTYLKAAATASEKRALGRNWRSDPTLVESLNAFLVPATLGDAGIVVQPVEAAHTGSRLQGAPRSEPLRVRQVGRSGLPRGGRGDVSSPEARAYIAQDCAAEIAAMVASGATWDGQPLQPKHFAVLVSKRAHGALVQEALRTFDIPAVLAGGDDVLSAEAGDEWLTLLMAMESPQRAVLVRAAALGPFFGVLADELDRDGDLVTARVTDVLRTWSGLLRRGGLAAVVEAADEAGLSRRILGRADGDRLITDLRHLGQVLHDAASTQRLGLTALIHWFHDERAAERAERPRRLESDAAAVQIVTIWGAKGLEYPIVHVPFAYDFYRQSDPFVRFHDDDGVRTLDVSGSGKTWSANKRRADLEEDGEELRKLYVALTRAQSQVVLWWAPTWNTPASSLNRIFRGLDLETGVVAASIDNASDSDIWRQLADAASRRGLSVEPARPAAAPRLIAGPPYDALRARTFARSIDTTWRRTSYSGLVRAAEQAVAMVGSEQVDRVLADEPIDVPDDVVVDPADLAPIGRLPRGTAFGSLVHEVLEYADPTASDLIEELTARSAELLHRWPVDVIPEELAVALVPVYATSLGPVADGLTLGDIAFVDRLMELEFEFPLAGGDRPLGDDEVRLRDLAPLLREYLPADDPLRPYADTLDGAEIGGQPLRGYLSGSIDVVLRLPSGRFVIADYKTNVLGTGLPQEYESERLVEAMLHSHYPLQAILYAVVLHRYLSLRLPGYDPNAHLGGVLYLYLRGMTGPDSTGGVFAWTPPAGLVVALSDTLGGAHA